MVCLGHLMDFDGFLLALGDFPTLADDDSVRALTSLWYRKMTQAVDKIPQAPLHAGQSQGVSLVH